MCNNWKLSSLKRKETDSEKYIYKTSISRAIPSGCFQTAVETKKNKTVKK